MVFKIALIKICDRIHNIRTMNDFSIEKIQEKPNETKRYIQRLAEEL
jgi:(p)ppGpp synthase/HD superfamily hydrolase